MTSRILYIPFDHLNRNKGALKDLDPKNDVVVMVESARMTSGRDWHNERLFFLKAKGWRECLPFYNSLLGLPR